MRFIRLFFVAFAFAGLCATSQAQEHGSVQEAMTLSTTAAKHIDKVGSEQAFKDFAADKAKWTSKDLYVAVTDFNGVVLYQGLHDKLVGKNLMDMKDGNGKLFMQEMVKVAAKGAGSVDYMAPHPVTKKMADKASQVVKTAKGDMFVSVGAYK